MSEGQSEGKHERLDRIKRNYWDLDWDLSRMLKAVNRTRVEKPSETDE
jgi:hypothetical protein